MGIIESTIFNNSSKSQQTNFHVIYDLNGKIIDSDEEVEESHPEVSEEDKLYTTSYCLHEDAENTTRLSRLNTDESEKSQDDVKNLERLEESFNNEMQQESSSDDEPFNNAETLQESFNNEETLQESFNNEETLQESFNNEEMLQESFNKDIESMGCIRVNMNLTRPINIVAGSRPPSIYDIMSPDETMDRVLTSFHLPRDTIKSVFINRETTVQEVIRALLKKFHIVDNPKKYAIYEYSKSTGEKETFRLLKDDERPLSMSEDWNKNDGHQFVLQENDTGDILWEEFSLPELHNFLKILDREESMYIQMVESSYTQTKDEIRSMLQSDAT